MGILIDNDEVIKMELSLTISAPGSKFGPIILRGDYVQQMMVAKAIGFQAVELHIRNPQAIDCRAIIKCSETKGIKVSTLGTGVAYIEDGIYFSSDNQAIREEATRRIMTHIDFASQLGAKVIIGTIKGTIPENGSPTEVEAAKKRAAECLKRCAEYAERKDTSLTVEAINRYETNFLNTSAQTLEFIKEIDAPNVGLHLDAFHMNIEEVSLTKAIKEAGSRLTHFHVADSNRLPPGQGHTDFSKIVAALKSVNYQGYLGVECLPLPDPKRAAIQTMEYLNRLLA
jgi:sugar phosphate isomerase/epimerase